MHSKVHIELGGGGPLELASLRFRGKGPPAKFEVLFILWGESSKGPM